LIELNLTYLLKVVTFEMFQCCVTEN